MGCCNFTFHYASTISDSSVLPAAVLPALHSTMLLLYRLYRVEGDAKTYLYIPLCFYYIMYDVKGVVADMIFTFHYASTISDICLDCLPPVSPLHSTMLLLYLTAEAWGVSTDVFTFHYASTISSAENADGATSFIFTFHYASTISCSTKFQCP